MANKTVIALPTSDRTNVDGHFGHAKEFAMFTIEDNKVVGQDMVVPPKHEPGVLPKFLAENGANVIITGGMGAMAVNLFKSNNVSVILGANGSMADVIAEYIQGNLESKGSSCNHTHGEDHDCSH